MKLPRPGGPSFCAGPEKVHDEGLTTRHAGGKIAMFPAILSTALLTAPGVDPSLEPWASKAQPRDVPRSHVETITTGEQKYVVVHGGTMDGTNCRSPMGCGMNREGAIEQTWQSNRAVRMENVGQTDVVDPWLSGGRNKLRKIKEMVGVAGMPGMDVPGKGPAPWQS